jgi:hypothetical protein
LSPYLSVPSFIFLPLFPRSSNTGAYILENTPPPGGRGISAEVIWGKKYDKVKRKRGKIYKKKEERGKKKEERGNTIRKREVKG